ncbi:MAG: type IV pilus secretin PilQ [Coxiellaceae bacterium]|nr:type IV pilus secretin PilQ [Coxiellaceae bacterium]
MKTVGQTSKRKRLLQSVLLLSTIIIPSFSHSYPSPPLSSNNSSSSSLTHDAFNPNKRLSLNFNDIKTRQLLQIIAQFTGLNFVVSDKVKGSMSIHLTNIPWQQALNVILKSQGLGQRQVGEVILVAPITALATQDIQELKIKEQVAELAPLQNRIIQLRYSKAEDVKKLLTDSGPLLSKRGQISIDTRTNSIWVRDTAKQLGQVIPLIKKLDFPVKQVLIEARIIRIERPYEREFGMRLGLTMPNHFSGTLSGANQVAQGITPELVNPISDRLNFNVPASSIFGATAGSVGLAVAHIGGSSVLDLELSALEGEGRIELVSSPRLITSSQHPAYIQTGEEIPYQEATSSGATAISFKDAVLSLKVTPQITPDKRVILELKVTNNRAGNPVTLESGGQAIPIVTEEEESRVILNNHQTVVLGGVYTQDKRKLITRIPFLGKIPLVGRLFSHETKRNNRVELMIFLTPHIVFKPSDLK